MSPEDRKVKIAEALLHLRFTVQLSIKQAKAGRLYMLEHPVGAATWITEAISALACMPENQFVNFDFCMMGMKSTNSKGKEVPACKLQLPHTMMN